MTKRNTRPKGNKYSSVSGTGSSSLSHCVDRETIKTAGTLLRVLTDSSEMRLTLLEDLSSKASDHMRVIDQSGDYPKLVEAVRMLDSTRLIELESYEWLGNGRVLLVYGPSDVIQTL